jgi:3-oxoacyl-[acyl-carrier-protein] synthase III
MVKEERYLKLSLGGVLAERAHDGTKLLGGDGAIAVLVKKAKRLLELGNLLLSQLVSHSSGRKRKGKETMEEKKKKMGKLERRSEAEPNPNERRHLLLLHAGTPCRRSVWRRVVATQDGLVG